MTGSIQLFSRMLCNFFKDIQISLRDFLVVGKLCILVLPLPRSVRRFDLFKCPKLIRIFLQRFLRFLDRRPVFLPVLIEFINRRMCCGIGLLSRLNRDDDAGNGRADSKQPRTERTELEHGADPLKAFDSRCNGEYTGFSSSKRQDYMAEIRVQQLHQFGHSLKPALHRFCLDHVVDKLRPLVVKDIRFTLP